MKLWTSERNWAVCGKLTMILISQMYENDSVTVDIYILGEFRYKYSNRKSWQKNNFWNLKERGIFVNYFTTVAGSLLKDLTWEEKKPSMNKKDRIPIKQISVSWRTVIKQRALVIFSFISKTPWQDRAIKMIEWRDYEKIQIDNLLRIFKEKTELLAKENVVRSYNAATSD